MKQFLRARSLVLAFTVAGLLAAVAYWGTRSSCVESGTGLRGEEKILPNGKHLYFNGQCWTTKPMPPLDTPF